MVDESIEKDLLEALSPADLEIIIKSAEKYQIYEVILFGSLLMKGQSGRDIDIGVRGIDPADFFQFWGEISRKMTRPIDVVDLSEQTPIAQIIEETGIKIYG